MQLNSTARPLIADQNIESHLFTIEAEDSGHIIAMLSDKLYSDKVLAVVREYMANAFDACIEAGNETPIVVTVPTPLSPVFKVRDFGLGLSKDRVLDVFIKMGRSTKRNDNGQVGAFGIGGKSFRAYGDSLNIVSIFNGVETTYTAQKEANGGNRLFVIREQRTTEPSGIEISISVNPKDIGTFESKILHMAKFFRVPPVLKGTDRTFQSVWEISDSVRGDGWVICPSLGGGKAYVVMGNIPYPIDPNLVDPLDRQIFFSDLFIDAPIGSVEVAPDREKLEYTARTKGYLRMAAKTIKEGFIENVRNSIENQPSYYEAMVAWYNFSAPPFCKRDTVKPSWKGLALEFDTKEIHELAYFAKPYWKNHKTFILSSRNFEFTTNTIFLVNTKDVNCMKQRAKTLMDKGHSVIVITCSRGNYKKLCEIVHFDLYPKDKIFFAENVEKTRLYDRTVRAAWSTRANAKVFTIDFSRVEDDIKCKHWRESEIDDELEEIVYVPLVNFNWKGHDMAAFQRMTDQLSTMGHEVEVYGLREKDCVDLPSNWITLDKFYAKKLEEFKKSVDLEDIALLKMCLPNVGEKICRIHPNPSPKIIKLRELLDRRSKASKYSFIAYEIQTPDNKNLESEFYSLEKEYPWSHKFRFEDDGMKRYLLLEDFARERGFAAN